MASFTPGHIDPATEPADIEWLAMVYLTQYLGATPISTALPEAPNNTSLNNYLPHGYLRVEYGGGDKCNHIEWDLSVILHGYSPNEIQASQICRQATGWAAAARGQAIAGWSVTRVPNVVAPHRLADPNVIGLIRYRSMVTWRIPGRLIVTPGS